MSQPFDPHQPQRPYGQQQPYGQSNPYGQSPQGPPPPPGWQPQQPAPVPTPKKRWGWLLPAVGGFLLGSIIGCAAGNAGDATTAAGDATPTVTVTQPGKTVTQAANGKPAPTVTVTESAKARDPKPPAPGTTIGDGQNQAVGDEIKAGSYKTSGDDNCYWARLRDDTGSFKSIIANGNPTGSARVKLKKGEFFTSQNCGTWKRVS